MIETYRGVAHPWLCDAMGHLNTRHYLAMFDDALHHFTAACGLDPHAAGSNIGLADVSIRLELRSEVRPGALLCVRSATAKIGRTSLTSYHEMTSVPEGHVHAICEIVSVQVDRVERRPVPLADPLRTGAAAFLLPSTPPSR